MKITNIEIKGFKGMRDLSVQPKSINVITGKNGASKTSLLEAIFYSFDASSLASDYTSRLSSLINVDMAKSEVAIKLENETKRLSLDKPEAIDVLAEFKKGVMANIKEAFRIARMAGDGEAYRTKDEKIIEKSEKIVDSMLNDEELAEELMNKSVRIEKGGENKILIDCNSRIKRHMAQLSECLGEIFGIFEFMINKHYRSLGSADAGLAEREPAIKFIRELRRRTSEKRSSIKLNKIQKYLKSGRLDESFKNLVRVDANALLFEEDGREYEIPFSSMGEGFKAITGLIATIEEENKIVLMEEPESRMHPAYIKELLSQVITLAETSQIQFFISTHSFDILDFLAGDLLEPGHQRYLDEELNLIRLENFEKDVIAAQTDRKDAKKALIDVQMDLRGQA